MRTDDHPRIVAIDPDATWLAALVALFAPHYRVIPCQTLQAGYAAAQLHRPDVVTLELNQVGDALGGVSLVPALCELPAYAQMVICGISGPAETVTLGVRQKIAAFHAGVDDYLVKGLPLDSIFCSIHLLVRVVKQQGHRHYATLA